MNSRLNQESTRQIQAIPTSYNGITFRSRLEARWAVFFDTLDVRYFYEYEGYRLPSGWYLPDFYLPHLDSFVEIKPSNYTHEEKRFCEELALATKKPVIFQWGNIDYARSGCDGPPNGDSFASLIEAYVDIDGVENAWGDWPCFWCECWRCGKIGVQFSGWSERICGSKCDLDRKTQNTDSPRLVHAYETAQKYRFW